MTECPQQALFFPRVQGRDVVVKFDAGHISSDGGAILLGKVERRFRIIEQFADCFTDFRDSERIDHSLIALLKQRIFALCMGYEDLNDHEFLRDDGILAVLVGKPEVVGSGAVPQHPVMAPVVSNLTSEPESSQAGEATGKKVRAKPASKQRLAGKSTLNRLELTPVGASAKSRFKKITANTREMQGMLVDLFIQQHDEPLREIVLDFDATDDPIHGDQFGKFFHGYYGHYCYMPLYVFCGDHPLLALLRPSNIDAAAGATKQLERIVARIRAAWPDVKIIVRADSGFCREKLMLWCEANKVDFILGLAKNKRLLKIIGGELHQAKCVATDTGKAARVFKDFNYSTQKSWARERRVIGKAEHLPQGPNPRFVVTSLTAEECAAQELYEVRYCDRGNAENRIKEQQLFLFADRTSCGTMRANQIRLMLSTIAYAVLRALRAYGLKDTALQSAQADTIRSKLLKIGTQVEVTARKVWLRMSESYPWQNLFAAVSAKLDALCAPVENLLAKTIELLTSPSPAAIATIATATAGSAGCESTSSG
ncbi:MAG: IS1380 family transposase [Pirellula sp.]